VLGLRRTRTRTKTGTRLWLSGRVYGVCMHSVGVIHDGMDYMMVRCVSHLAEIDPTPPTTNHRRCVCFCFWFTSSCSIATAPSRWLVDAEAGVSGGREGRGRSYGCTWLQGYMGTCTCSYCVDLNCRTAHYYGSHPLYAVSTLLSHQYLH
jgi:hypothetical protein